MREQRIKVGDRVEIIRDNANGATVKAGDTGTVKDIFTWGGDTLILVKTDVWRDEVTGEVTPEGPEYPWAFDPKYVRHIDPMAKEAA